MKKILIGLVVVVVIVAGGAFFLLSNLNGFVKTAIESYGSEAIGAQVTVGSVDINLQQGSASLYDFSIANLPGNSDRSLLSFSELSVSLDLTRISQELIVISDITTRNPHVSYERANGTSNIDELSARLSSEEPQEPASAGSESEMQLEIGNILIEGIQATVSDSILPSPVEIALGDIVLSDLAGTPAEISQQILTPLMSQIASNAGSAFLNMSQELLGDQLENLGDLGNQVGEKLDETVGESVREGLGNLFGN